VGVPRQRLGKHAPAATNTHATIRVELSDAVRVIGGDEKGTQCLGVQPDHPVPGGHKYGDLAFQVGGVSNLRR
jgi:hypothetical protein